METSQSFLEPDRLLLTGFKRYAPGSGRLRPDVILSRIQIVRAEPAVTALVTAVGMLVVLGVAAWMMRGVFSNAVVCSRSPKVSVGSKASLSIPR